MSKLNLSQFTGTGHYYYGQISYLCKLVYTDGVQYVAREANAYWLIDAIASYQPRIRAGEIKSPDRNLREFQLWTLTLRDDGQWELCCYADSGLPPVITQVIESSDFPEESIRFYVEPYGDGGAVCLLLPSEH